MTNKAEGILVKLNKKELALLIQRAFPKELDFGKDSE